MKYVKVTTIAFAITCSVNAHAGLFSSNDDFKCGRDDAINAVQHYIKDTTAGLIQNESIKQSETLMNKPLNVFLAKLDSVQVDVVGVSTLDNSSASDVSCQAKISISLPKEAMDVIHSIPEQMSEIQLGDASFHNDSIVWEKYTYGLKLSDDKKNISVTDNMDNIASNSLFGSVIMAVNKNEIISAKNEYKYNVALERYHNADFRLNEIWKDMSDSVRASMKSSQLSWVKEKTTKCGKISDATADIKDVDTRVNILNCQTKMTSDRISLLVGDN